MKMAVRFLQVQQLLLVMMCLALLSACGSSDENDLTSPSLTLDALPSTTFERKKTLKGSVEAGADVVITVNTSAMVEKVPVEEDGIWSYTISDLAVGSNTVTVRAADADGNSSSLQFVLTYDILKIDQIDTVTADAAPTLYGRLAPSSLFNSVTVTLDGNAHDPPVPEADGTFSLKLKDLAEGSHTVAITAEDQSAVPLSQTISQTILRDATAVSLTVDQPSITPELHEAKLTGTVEVGGDLSVAVSPEAKVSYNSIATPWSVDISDLEEGESTLIVSAAVDRRPTAKTWIRVTVSSLPTVISTVPENEASDVSIDAVVTATFSEAVVGTTVNADTFYLKDGSDMLVEGTVSYNATDKEATFTPAAPLKSGETYTATTIGVGDPVIGVKDPDGNFIDFPPWKFTVQ